MKKRKKRKIEYEVSSGNVFADLGIPNPEEALAESERLLEIDKAIRRKKLSQQKSL